MKGPPRLDAPDLGRKRHLGNTWPYFDAPESPAFPIDPSLNVTPFRPDSDRLSSLRDKTDLPETTEQAELQVKRLREGASDPDKEAWARAARVMANWLAERLEDDGIDPADQAAVARLWATFSLGGATEPLILKVAHLVSRAHAAIRSSPRSEGELQAAIRDCAGVVQAALPRVISERMPLERIVDLVRRLRLEGDAWKAVVDGTSELLGWNDYARVHAAALLRAVIERGHRDVG